MDESKVQSSIIQELDTKRNDNEISKLSSQHNEKAEIRLNVSESLNSQNNIPENTQNTNSDEVRSMRNFYVISSGYLLFTLTDSGLRMIVLFELYNEHYGALQTAIMLTSYEFLGVVTNLVGGILGSRLGLRTCFISGLVTQVIGIGMLCGLPWITQGITFYIYVIIAQGFSGMAKDLVKLGGKSITKLVTKSNDDHQSQLFKLVAWLTGAKNSVKGAGFFLGAFLFYFVGFIPSLAILLVMNLVVIPFAFAYVESDLAVSKSKEKLTFGKIFNKGRDVNILSIARMFLFSSRDLWFEVPLPFYLRGPIGWQYLPVGAFIAGWVIFYGVIQSSTPLLILKPLKIYPVKHAYCHKDKVAMNVGFYYMANAMGRLAGLLIGGLLYTYFEFDACLWASVIALAFCTGVSFLLGPVPEN
ncbi:13842_t:CDS:2 [Dentiscutata erythropus]|uniref:13842_t:CDS:1 n=1 Tax=Dentiscutata erythropus TaxID=1348616 RepID=A0A9N9FD12_9GLOM|nr:13842_t:CDS:2 [Dentiscutata erythropus]